MTKPEIDLSPQGLKRLRELQEELRSCTTRFFASSSPGISLQREVAYKANEVSDALPALLDALEAARKAELAFRNFHHEPADTDNYAPLLVSMIELRRHFKGSNR